jgi:site-specific DNA-methyltransferase (adenine-specific)
LSPPEQPMLTTKLGALYAGDCVDLMRALPDESVDLFFADPPFNLGKDYGAAAPDNHSEERYLAWSYDWLAEGVRLLKPGGSMFVYNLPKWAIPIGEYLRTRLTFRHWISVEIKFGLPIAGRLYPSHYALLYFVKGKRPNRFDPPRLAMPTCRHCGGELPDYGGYKDKMNPKGLNLSDVWSDIAPVRHSRFKNREANELSLKLMDRVLDIGSAPGDLVLDPFGGAGTTYVAAELKHRHWLGFELSTSDAIVSRFADLDQDRTNLRRFRSGLNRLFTPDALALRARSGMDRNNHRYKLADPDDDAPLNGEAHQLSLEATSAVEPITEGVVGENPTVAAGAKRD